MLQTAPKLTFDSILDGSFQNKITDYISDQFPARDTWTQLGSQVKKLAGFKDIGGAYLGSDGYYMERSRPTRSMKQICGAISGLFPTSCSRAE